MFKWRRLAQESFEVVIERLDSLVRQLKMRVLTWCLCIDVECWPWDVDLIFFHGSIVVEVKTVVAQNCYKSLSLIVPTAHQEISSMLDESFHMSCILCS